MLCRRKGDTIHAGKAPSQALGKALFDLKETRAFVTFSAKLPEFRILGIFPQKLCAPDEVRYSYDDNRGESQIVKIP